MVSQLYLHFLHSDHRILVKHNTTAGRSSSRCELVLTRYFAGRTDTISATHFKIAQWESGQYVIIDLGSSNGTWLNGEKLMPFEARPIYDHDLIQVTSNKLFRMQAHLREADYEESAAVRESTAATAVLSNIQDRLGIQYDPINSLFFVDNKPIPDGHLNDQERDLLHLFYENEDEVCTFIDIEDKVWGIPVAKNTLTQKVVSLRKKLDEIVPDSGRQYIQSIHGRGYKYTKRRP